MAHLTGWFVSEEVTGHNHEAYEESAGNPDIYIEAQGYGTIAHVSGGLLEDRRIHARLIAAAPELLAECERLVDAIDAAGWHKSITEHARTTIANATGP